MQEAKPAAQYPHLDILNKMAGGPILPPRRYARRARSARVPRRSLPGPELRTLVLLDGSILKLIDVKSVHVHQHFWSSDKYYVRLEIRNGEARDDIEHASHDDARNRQNEIVSLMRHAWDEVDPFECGYQAGAAEARSEGHNAGLAEGRSQGYQAGSENGFREGQQSVLFDLLRRREDLIREKKHGEQIPPSRRRYLRNAIAVLTEIIRYFSPEHRQDKLLERSKE
jgi:hypothetical protein